MPSSCALIWGKFQKCPQCCGCCGTKAPVGLQEQLHSHLSVQLCQTEPYSIKNHWDSQLESIQEGLKGFLSIFYYFLVAEFPLLLLPAVPYISFMQIPSIHGLSNPTFRQPCIDPSLICDSPSHISADQGRLYPCPCPEKAEARFEFPVLCGQTSWNCEPQMLNLTDGLLAVLQRLKRFQTHQIESWWPTGSQEGPRDVEVDV